MRQIEWGAWILWCDAYWTQERESEYRWNRHRFGFERQIDIRPETPPMPNRSERLVEVAQILGKVEGEWGKSYSQAVRDMYDLVNDHPDFDKELSRVAYRTLMAVIGHGVFPGDESEWERTGLPDSPGWHLENPFSCDALAIEDRPMRTHKNPFPEGYLSLFEEGAVA
jgi:hypothetical protein